MMPEWFVIAAAGAFGLVFGSFLNVVIYRLPLEMSLVRPRSHCISCNMTINWYDNVPVLSFLLLLGRCRFCRAKISFRYPLVELATGGLLALVFWRFGLSVMGIEAAVFVLLLIPLALIDLDHHLLPDVLTWPGIGLGFLGALLSGLTSWRNALIGVLAGALLPYLVLVTYRLIRGVEGMGMGDVKLLAMVGAFLGWRGMLITLGLGSTLGALVGLALMMVGKGQRDTELPFGTFLAVGALIALFFGAHIARFLFWTQR